MKLEVLQENLNHALSLISRVLPSKPSVPVLTNILLSARDGKLTLTASNLETSLVTSVGAKITTDGDFTVPGKTFSEIVSSLPPQKSLMALDGGVLTLKSTGFSARINGIPASEYPPLAVSPNEPAVRFEIDTAELLSGVEKTVFASAQDESRANLTGVLFRFTGKTLVLAATDGFRLSVVHFKKTISAPDAPDLSLIIPAGSLTELVRILSGASLQKLTAVKIIVYHQTNQIVFSLGETTIFSRLITGNFPDYEKIIPSSSSHKLSVSTEELSQAIRLASIFARDSANIVKLRLAASKMAISANSPQVGENETEISFHPDGSVSDMEIAFNYRYLQEYLATVSGGEVVVGFSGSTAPGVFRLPTDSGYLHIIMPVRVQS